MVTIVKSKMVLLDPVAEAAAAAKNLAPRPDDLKGKVVGLLWNDEDARSFDLKRVEELLQERCEPAEIIRRVKPVLSRVAPKEMIAELAERCHVVIGATCQ